jgi:hypothetical protein
MSYQYAFCPTCGTKRVAHDYRCTVCDGLMRRVPIRVAHKRGAADTVVDWPSDERAESLSTQQRRAAA